MLIFWIVIFIISFVAMVKGADLLLRKAERIGLAWGLSPFVVGVVIVGLGTSFPELISSLAAVFKGVTEIATANVIGSNISNILLIVGITAVMGRQLVVTKNLIDLDLPLLAIGTVLVFGVMYDGVVNLFESILLLGAFVIYLLYTILHKEEQEEEVGKREAMKALPSLPHRKERRKHIVEESKPKPMTHKPKIAPRDFLLLVAGIVLLGVGAKYLIDAVIVLSELLNIAPGVISITAVAVGTSLPELLVSAKAAYQNQAEVALGNIFGSNIFNGLLVLGFSGLFKTLELGELTLTIGLPAMMLATLIFIISGISRRIWVWEGAMYLVVYALFLAKLFQLF
jgi:cation:H+ antiporter